VFLVVGLGNPGREYQDNRHNIGFMVVDALASRWRVGPMRSKFGGEVAVGEAHGERLAILKPLQFMNVSGEAAARAAAFYQVEPERVIVVHDEIDLDFGRIKVKVGGGHGGHNGLRSLCDHLGPGFLRVRCGVGRPGGGAGDRERVVGHVLGPFSRAEQKELPLLIETAADAVESLVREGTTATMNRFNRTTGD
jgi:PTH1 family peptidyl-tRNA hydrolase